MYLHIKYNPRKGYYQFSVETSYFDLSRFPGYVVSHFTIKDVRWGMSVFNKKQILSQHEIMLFKDKFKLLKGWKILL